MGIYDRDYYRQPRRSFSLSAPRTIVGTLILINVIIFLADGLLTPVPQGAPPGACGGIAGALALKVEDLTKPWMWWQLLTYGFAHASFESRQLPWHIIGNMIVLFFLGPPIEARYGRKEFLRLYLAMVVIGGLAWAIVEKLQQHEAAAAVGASAAVTGVVILFALNFPRQILLLFFVIPMPAWVVGLLVVVFDIAGALHADTVRVAFAAHLGGAAFAFLHFQYRWNLTRWTSRWPSLARLKPRPRLRVHDPDADSDRDRQEDSELGEEVDRILKKIHKEGEGSLTRKERRILENASRQYQKKREGPDD